MSMIGCAVYCAYKFRPDLQPTAFACSRKMSAPTQQTFTWTWRVWRYVVGSLNWVLFAKKNRKLHDGSPMEMHTKHRDTDATIDDNLWSQADAKVFSDAGWTVPRSMTGVAGKAHGMLVLSKATIQSKRKSVMPPNQHLAEHSRFLDQGSWWRLLGSSSIAMDDEVGS